jgi:hypothetical protein
MTQRHISHPEGLPKCAAWYSARHIHLRGRDRVQARVALPAQLELFS